MKSLMKHGSVCHRLSVPVLLESAAQAGPGQSNESINQSTGCLCPKEKKKERCDSCRLNVKVLLSCAISLIWKIFTLHSFLSLEKQKFLSFFAKLCCQMLLESKTEPTTYF